MTPIKNNSTNKCLNCENALMIAVNSEIKAVLQQLSSVLLIR